MATFREGDGFDYCEKMYNDKVVWTNKDGIRRERLKYQCGQYAKSKYGQCKKNSILAEWVAIEVIVYMKRLVSNKQFTDNIKKTNWS